MPGAKTHTIIGSIIALLLYWYVSVPTTPFPNADWATLPMLCVWVLLASNLPDIDHHSSRVSVWVTFLLTALALIFVLQERYDLLIYLLSPVVLLWGLRALRIIKHRGLCHNWIFGTLILPLPALLWFDYTWYLYAAILCFQHILLDKAHTALFDKRKKENGKKKRK